MNTYSMQDFGQIKRYKKQNWLLKYCLSLILIFFLMVIIIVSFWMIIVALTI